MRNRKLEQAVQFAIDHETSWSREIDDREHLIGLALTERDDGANSGHAPRGNVTGQHRNRGKKGADGGERERIARRDLEQFLSLLGPQCNHRIDTGRAPYRKICRTKRRDCQQDARPCEHTHIGRRHAEQECGEHAGYR